MENPINILVADDDSTDRKFLIMDLKEHFRDKKVEVEIHPAENGEIAIEIINKLRKQLSLVITDINMPCADGNEVAKCAIENGIPVIIVSANLKALKPDISKQCVARFDVPANEERLMNTIDKVLEINQL